MLVPHVVYGIVVVWILWVRVAQLQLGKLCTMFASGNCTITFCFALRQRTAHVPVRPKSNIFYGINAVAASLLVYFESTSIPLSFLAGPSYLIVCCMVGGILLLR